METAKILEEIYKQVSLVEDAKLAKHTLSSLVLNVLEDLEQDGKPITAENIHNALKKELELFSRKPEVA